MLDPRNMLEVSKHGLEKQLIRTHSMVTIEIHELNGARLVALRDTEGTSEADVAAFLVEQDTCRSETWHQIRLSFAS